MAVLDNVSNFAVGAVLESVGIGKVGNGQLFAGGDVAFAVTRIAVAHGAVDGPPLLGASQGFRRRLDRVGLLGGLGRNGGIRRLSGFLRGLRLLPSHRTREQDGSEKNESRHRSLR